LAGFFRLVVTALTTLSQRWNTYVWLAAAVVEILLVAAVALVVCLLQLAMP
jgi:hypothetical protein